MVLVRELSGAEVERHSGMIRAFAKTTMGTDHVEIEFWGNGQEKGVYRVTFDEKAYLAVAARREGREFLPGKGDSDGSLLDEYTILHELYQGVPSLFPRPVAHYRPEDLSGDLVIMELLPHRDLDILRRENVQIPNLNRKIAEGIGFAVAVANLRTGRYPSEPHDGNILGRVDNDGNVDLRFCDAIQFKKGDLENAVRTILTNKDERPESYRFITRFREGLAKGVGSVECVPYETALPRFDFLRDYNPIF